MRIREINMGLILCLLLILMVLMGCWSIASGIHPETWPPRGRFIGMMPWQRIGVGIIMILVSLFGGWNMWQSEILKPNKPVDRTR